MKTTLKVENAGDLVADDVFDYQEKVDDVLEMHDEILAMHMNILKVNPKNFEFEYLTSEYRKMLPVSRKKPTYTQLLRTILQITMWTTT